MNNILRIQLNQTKLQNPNEQFLFRTYKFLLQNIYMRFAQQRTSPMKRPTYNNAANQRNQFNYRLESQKVYMHYNNAIYMGGMVSFKRNGIGIMLMDDGTSAITQYCYDSLTGHSIIYRENCIISVLFMKNNSYEVVIRTGQCIIKLPFYEKQNLPNGNGVLIDFKNKKIYHIFYLSGKIVRKIVQTNSEIINQIFDQNILPLFDKKHVNALKFNLNFHNGIKLIKEGKKIVIGYANNRNHLEGLCFKLKVDEQFYDNFAIALELKCIERGFYERSRLQNYGQRYFSNGNLYIGQFEDDVFEGKGILLYPQEEKWVFGQFGGEKLKKMLQMNLGRQQPHACLNVKQCLKQIHQYNTKNWMDVQIFLFQWVFLQLLYQNALASQITDVVIQRQKVNRQQQTRLLKIQQHFSSEIPNDKINKVMTEQKMKNQIQFQKIYLNQFSSLKSKELQIQPRNVENQDYWTNNAPSRLHHSPSKPINYKNVSSWSVISPKSKLRSTGLSPIQLSQSPSKLISGLSYKKQNYSKKQ